MPNIFVPIAEPQIIEEAYSPDQHQRLVCLIREKGPWPLVVARHFKSPEEIVATTSGMLPPGVKPTWDMFLSPVFRGILGTASVALYPEIEDCFLNSRFLELVRHYWGARHARPESMLFNIQGPSSAGGSPHVDGTRFRGIDLQTSPVWLMNMMVKSGLFERWRARKAQVIAWYYRGRIGGGFTYWPEGLAGAPRQIEAPMWGRGVVVENEKMYHTAESCGPKDQRRPAGLTIDSVMESDPEAAEAWRIRTGETIVQHIPAEEFRLLVHWGAEVFMDDRELEVTLDRSDDLNVEQVLDMFTSDLRRRGIAFNVPSQPLSDPGFIELLTRTYDPGKPAIFPPEPEERAA